MTKKNIIVSCSGYVTSVMLCFKWFWLKWNCFFLNQICLPAHVSCPIWHHMFSNGSNLSDISDLMVSKLKQILYVVNTCVSVLNQYTTTVAVAVNVLITDCQKGWPWRLNDPADWLTSKCWNMHVQDEACCFPYSIRCADSCWEWVKSLEIS